MSQNNTNKFVKEKKEKFRLNLRKKKLQKVFKKKRQQAQEIRKSIARNEQQQLNTIQRSMSFHIKETFQMCTRFITIYDKDFQNDKVSARDL